jgi:hypothetical protein
VPIGFDQTTRSIIDGDPEGCAGSSSTGILIRCRAVDVAQVAYLAVEGGGVVARLAQMPLWFPTYAGMIARVGHNAALR